MKSGNEVYFRQRAEHHLAKAAAAERHVACVHRRFAKIYLERAAEAELAQNMQAAAPEKISRRNAANAVIPSSVCH
ncbi:hypothetical protein [Sphingobium vermicomposti]|uniref:Uncharacterized protein n=1 Tax=Sphingobium vermicomposti TaxID=529005 RepID=A0A846MGS9_9SPHN|nr:hypothetical protein [Sphingobium vermicomposti]NIJ16286.1 hypothetical protein [Sphingobium vermicomposti]